MRKRIIQGNLVKVFSFILFFIMAAHEFLTVYGRGYGL